MVKTMTLCLFFLSVLTCLSGCSQKEHDHGPQYHPAPLSVHAEAYSFAVHPLHNPAKLAEAYQPLVSCLNQHLPPGSRLKLEASQDYAQFEEKIANRLPELLLPNPWQTLQALDKGYSVIAMAGDPEDFKGIFIVRKDSDIRVPTDLKGKAVSYPSPTALAACIMPQYFLHRQGINVMHDIQNRYVGSQESAIMNAYLGQTAVGVTWPPPWRAFQKTNPNEAAQLRVLWETPHLINNSVMIRDDLPIELREKIRAVLLNLHTSPEGRAILAGMETSRFTAATNQSYDQVRRYVTAFEREVRPVVTKP
jgi:phosphonate transport system substrate-binding protein